MPAFSEVPQAIGALSQIIMANESQWGNQASLSGANGGMGASVNWRKLRLVPGESLDIGLTLNRSRQIRSDRMRNATVRGNQKPAGNIPFELSPNGWNQFFYHLLGGSVVTTGPTGGLATPAAPTVTPTGSAGTTTYSYKVTAINALGETLPGPAGQTTTGNATLSGTNYNALSWTSVPTATGYKVYGRTSGSWLLLAQTAGTTYNDTGAATPSGAVPTYDTSGVIYTHVIKGGTSLPTGFNLEKGFLDIGYYFPFFGCRVNRGEIRMTTDQLVTGMFDILAREGPDNPSTTSINSAQSGGQASPQTPVSPTDPPYTAAMCQVYEGSSLTLLGTARDLTLTIDNQLYAESGFVLGSNLRDNLKPGDRVTTLSGKFQFNSVALYNEAINGTGTKIRIIVTNGTYLHQIDLPTFQFLPNGTVPKITDEGPLEVDAAGEALPDQGLGSDVQLTIQTSEPSITV